MASITIPEAKHWSFHAASNQGHVTYSSCGLLVYDLFPMDPLEELNLKISYVSSTKFQSSSL